MACLQYLIEQDGKFVEEIMILLLQKGNQYRYLHQSINNNIIIAIFIDLFPNLMKLFKSILLLI